MFFLFSFSSSLKNACLPCQLLKAYADSEQPTVLLAWRHLNTIILANYENLISI